MIKFATTALNNHTRIGQFDTRQTKHHLPYPPSFQALTFTISMHGYGCSLFSTLTSGVHHFTPKVCHCPPYYPTYTNNPIHLHQVGTVPGSADTHCVVACVKEIVFLFDRRPNKCQNFDAGGLLYELTRWHTARECGKIAYRPSELHRLRTAAWYISQVDWLMEAIGPADN